MKVSVLNLDNPYSSLVMDMAEFGIEVCAYDANPDLERYFDPEKIYSNFSFTTNINKSIVDSEYIFLLHEMSVKKYYDGTTPMGNKKFVGQSYDGIVQTLSKIKSSLNKNQKIVLIGNVAPKTCRQLQEIVLDNELIYLCFATSMENTKIDFRESFKGKVFEKDAQHFHLGNRSGTENANTKKFISDFDFLPAIKLKKYWIATWEEVELLNMFSRSWDALQNTFLNTVQHTCSKIGADTKYVTKNIFSHMKNSGSQSRFWQAGTGFGYDYPQTLVDMSLLTNQIDLGYDIFKEMIIAREKQAKHIASKILEEGVAIMFSGISYDRHSMTHDFYLDRNLPEHFSSFVSLVKHYSVQMGAKLVDNHKDAEVYVCFSKDDKLASQLDGIWPGRVFEIQNYYGRRVKHNFIS